MQSKINNFFFVIKKTLTGRIAVGGGECKSGTSLGCIDIGRLLYNFGALLSTTGVGSEL